MSAHPRMTSKNGCCVTPRGESKRRRCSWARLCMLSVSPTYTRAPKEVNMGETGTIQYNTELCQSLSQPMSQGCRPIQRSKKLVLREALEANMVSHTLAPTRMIVSKLSTLPVLQQMDQKLRTIRTFSAATQHLLVTAALPAFSSGHGRDLNMSVALRRASRHGSWSSFDLTSMFKACPKSDRCFAALLRVLMFAKSLLNFLL